MVIKKIIFIPAVIIISLFMFLSCGSEPESQWVARINEDTITLGQFNTFYYAQQKSIYNGTNKEIDARAADPDEVSKNPLLSKAEFLENLIRQKLVYNEAVENGVLDNKEVKALVQMAQEAIVVGYFVKEKFKDQINVTEEEIGQVYTKQKARFRGVPIEQAEQYIRQQLTQQKLQLKLRDLVESLRDEGKIEKKVGLFSKTEEGSIKESKEGEE